MTQKQQTQNDNFVKKSSLESAVDEAFRYWNFCDPRIKQEKELRLSFLHAKELFTSIRKQIEHLEQTLDSFEERMDKIL